MSVEDSPKVSDSRLFMPSAGPWWWVVVDCRDGLGRWRRLRRWARHPTESAAETAAAVLNARAPGDVRFRVELEALERELEAVSPA